MGDKDELHNAIADYLRRQYPGSPRRRRNDPPPAAEREAALDARVASIRGWSTDLEGQVAACRAHARARGDEVVLIFREVADGLTLDRPRLAALRAAIARGWIATVLVTGLDRLARDPQLIAALEAEWAAGGVALVVAGGGR